MSGGTVSNTELIQSANRAMVLGVAKSVEDFGTLMGIARIRARDMGISVTQAFNDIVTGIGRNSPLILDNLGIIIKQEEAQNKYALSLGKTADKLTENEKKESVRFAVLSEARKEIERMGTLQATYAERIQQTGSAYDNFKNNIGQSFLPAMEAIFNVVGNSTDQLNANGQAIEQSQKRWTVFSNVIYRATQTILILAKSVGLAVQAVVVAFSGVGNTIAVFGTATVDYFKGIIKGVGSLGGALKGLLSGDFDKVKESVQEFKDGFSFENTRRQFEVAIEKTSKSTGQFKKQLDGLTASIDGAVFGKGFVSVAEGNAKAADITREKIARLDKQLKDGQITKEDYNRVMTSLTGQTNDAGNAIQATGDKTKKAKDETKNYASELENLAIKSKEASNSIGEDLTKAYEKSGNALRDNVKETSDKLAQIVVDAEKKKAELTATIAKGGDTTEAQKQLTEVQRTLDARVGYEQRAQERINAIKQKAIDAGLDPAKLGLDALTAEADIEAKITEQKRLASLDEFTRFEETQAKKLEKIATDSIAELTILKNKYDTQKQYEQELTDFVLSKNKMKEASVVQFANTAISKYGEVASALRNVISLQAQVGGGSKLPQFHDGGYVGARGGEVHPGEFVIPADLVRKMRNLVSQLDAMRGGQVNNININAGAGSQADYSVVAQEIAWRIQRG
jgi:hypothetical protein